MSPILKKILLGLFFVAAAIALFKARVDKPSKTPLEQLQASPRVQELATKLTSLEKTEDQITETVWKNELVAERYGRILENLWDAVNATTNRLDVLAGFSVQEILLPGVKERKKLPYEIEATVPGGASSVLKAAEWKSFVRQFQADGWELAGMELRHNAFSPNIPDDRSRSRYYFSGHFFNKSRQDRAILEGDLLVDWKKGPRDEPILTRIDASQITLKRRGGEPLFQLVFKQDFSPPRGSDFIDPLIARDLDGDGKVEIVLAGANLLLRRSENGDYKARSLCQTPPELIFTGMIADFDNDGIPDFLCARFEGLYLYKGSAGGTFAEAGRLVWAAKPHLHYCQVLACGDVDGDGDLDVWLAQFKLPYERGQMPSPYFDANDGDPSYLLLNDGNGNFSDGTESAGLSRKRWRRTYSASFADIDHDGDLDLIVVSDFAGLDLYRNDGHGHFTEATHELAVETHAFGMSHVLADFNRDGAIDLLMIGMNSATAERLGSMGLDRPAFEYNKTIRAAMVYGNRLYFGSAEGYLQPGPWDSPINRSGWSWGAGAMDMNNDGYPDLYVANGHESRRSVRDYEPQFWLHDIYVGDSKADIVKYAYFSKNLTESRSRGESYGGYEMNRLYWNQTNGTFLEIGFLMGLGLQADSRNVLAEDLDGDGNVDLIVTTHEVAPEARQTLRIYKNNFPKQHHWIGFRFLEEKGRVSPWGTEITLYFPGGKTVAQIVTGDSYRSQHSPTVHFGLGDVADVEKVEIRTPNRPTVILARPTPDQYHLVQLPERTRLDH